MLPPPSPAGDFWVDFIAILFEGIPFILLGSIVSGLVDAYVSARQMDRWIPRQLFPAVLVSGLLGIVFPVCECAIVPIIRRLVQKGLPISCAMTYMLAAPIVNPIVGVSTWAAFQGRDPMMMTGSRLLLGYAIAVLVGLVMSRFSLGSLLRKPVLDGIQSAGGGSAAAAPKSADDREHRVIHAPMTAQRDFIDTLLYFTIGVAIAALLKTQVLHRPDLQEGIRAVAGQHLLAAPTLMVTAFVMSLCSTTDAFIVAADDIFSPIAKLGFLVFGPMMDMKLVFLYATVLKPRVVLGLALGLFVAVYLGTFAFEAVWPPAGR
jgi:uncharacterized protein